MDRQKYDLAERGAVGWHASAADGNSSTSGYRDLDAVLPDLAEGAYIIDKRDLYDLDPGGFALAVYRAPMHGPDSRGGFLEALREVPAMAAVAAAYCGPETLEQIRHEGRGEEGYGPMDYAPAEYHARYWRDRGAKVYRYDYGRVVREEWAR